MLISQADSQSVNPNPSPVISLSAVENSSNPVHEKVLSIDIGGTRVKARIIREDATITDLTGVDIVVLPSLYFNQKISELFQHDGPLIPLTGLDFDRAHVLVPAEVTPDGADVVPRRDLDLPPQLGTLLTEVLGKPVTLKQDAVGALEGYIALAKLKEQPIQLPMTYVAFGTGIGVGFAAQNGSLKKVSISGMKVDWTPLQPYVGNLDVSTGTRVHGRIRRMFEQFRDSNITKVELLKAVNTFLTIMVGQMKSENVIFSELAIGGGWSNFLKADDIDLGPHSDINVTLVNQETCGDLDADLIPLLNILHAPKRA